MSCELYYNEKKLSILLKKAFEDTKGIISRCKLKDTQHNAQRTKKTNNDIPTLHRKRQIE